MISEYITSYFLTCFGLTSKYRPNAYLIYMLQYALIIYLDLILRYLNLKGEEHKVL